MTTVYRPTEAIAILKPCVTRPCMRLSSRTARVAFSTSRCCRATHTSTPSSNIPPSQPRKHITVVNDDGRVRWGDLSVGEKAARTTQQGFNLAVVLLGVAMTGAVGILLFTDVLSPDSKTAHFNRATTRVRESPECQRLLGPGAQIAAYGEASWSRWARNRFIASTTETDRWGTEHLHFRFYVEGPQNQGTVTVHMTKKPSQNEYEYRMLAVDVKGHARIYLENADENGGKKAPPKIFGARWW